MTTTKTTDRDFDVQILNETIRGAFKMKTALFGSLLASSGAIVTRPNMGYGRDMIGNTITIPYFGTLGEFSANAEDTAATPQALKMKSETATVARQSLAFEVSRWAQLSGPEDGDPYEEAARQIREAAVRAMDSLCITEAATTPLVKDVYSATAASASYLNWDLVTDGRAKWGDEQDSIVGMVVHSQVEAGLRKLRDANGRPLLLDGMVNGDSVTRFNGIPLVISDRLPLTSSTMGTVTEAGTTPPDVTLSGTPTGAWDLKLKVIVGGARGTATFQFSTDGGNTWSETLTTAPSVALTDTASDSLVGNNGSTGLTAAFESATFNVDNTWVSKAYLKASSLIFQRDAMAFWYNANAMELLTDKDILKDNDVAAMHLYYAPKLYRRRRGGSRPGVVKLVHNVPGWIG